MNQETFEKTAVAHVETLVERDALEELLKHPLLAELPRAEGYPVLGSYVLFAQLGSGGMANVFRGVHIRLENEVAIKIRTAPVGTSAARFQREATVAAKLEHQNLVRATDVDEIGGLQYMVLDYIDGEDADERVARKGALEPREALTIIRDSALGLAEAHRLDFIHRDIKPANVMISREGRVKLADLGLAKSVVDDDLGLTATGGLLGTPMYMAPEQFRRAEEVVKASDVYGLGVTLVFLLTGRHPFNGKSVPEIMQQVCVQGVTRVDQTRPGLDPRVGDLVAEIVALKVEDRPQDGAALAARIDAVLTALGGPVELFDHDAGASKARGVNPPNKVARTRIKAAATRVEAGPASATAVVETKSSKLRWVAAAMLLAAGGGIGWTVLEKREGGAMKVINDLVGGESTSTGPKQPNELTLDARGQDVTEIPFDVKAISTIRKSNTSNETWGAGYVELLGEAQAAQAVNQLGAMVGEIEKFSDDVQGEHRYKSISALLDEEGQAALSSLAELAHTAGVDAPWTSITAAELGVEFNGLNYEIDAVLAENTNRHLRMAAQGDNEEAAARSRILQGIILVNQFLADPKDATGQKAQDLLTESAEAEPDGEAAAWLGIMYLSFLDRGKSEADVPMWFETKDMLKFLEAAAGETETGDADYVLGHMCSDGLAGIPKSFEVAKGHYFNGARRGHVGCVSDAVLRGVDLKGKLSEDGHDIIEHFTESVSRDARVHAREAYALAALTSSFEDPTQEEERRMRAIGFLQANADEELAAGLDTDRQFDRITICLGAMLRGSELFGAPTEEANRAWLDSRVPELAREICSDKQPMTVALPIWLQLARFDPELAKRVLVAEAGASANGLPVEGLVEALVAGVDGASYVNSPFVWSFIEPAIAALEAR